MRFLIVFVVALTLLMSAGEPVKPGEKTISRIDSFVSSTLDSCKSVPGMVLAVVDQNGVLFENAYGVRDVKTMAPVTLQTPFYIASSTKSFTALATALLAHKKKLDLDMPLARALPGITLNPPLDAGKITIRDLLTHQSRMENTAVVYRTAYTGEHTPEMLRMLLNASSAGNEGFDYSNLGYVITGLIMQNVTGKDWKTVVKEEVFDPMNMQHTFANTSDLDTNLIAAPHFCGANGPQRIRLLKKDATLHAAGGHFSTVGDLSRWVSMQLNEGRLQGKQIFPAAIIGETHRKQAEVDRNFYRFHRYGYGLGWYLSTFADQQLIHHFGSFSGYRAHISFMPEHNIGVIALINDFSPSSIFIPDLIAGYIYESFLDRDSVDTRYQAATEELRQRGAQMQARFAAQQFEEVPSSKRSFFAGQYGSEAMGVMLINDHDKQLAVSLGELRSTMTQTKKPLELRVELIPNRGQLIEFFGNAPNADSLRYRGYTFTRSK